MCLILFAHNCHPGYSLVLGANRDEFYERPTAAASYWDDPPGILAGRDLRYGGTWMGVTVSGRFGAVTNFRDQREFRKHPRSRGLMVRDYLAGTMEPEVFLEKIVPLRGDYNGFNLLLGQGGKLLYYSNRQNDILELPPGVYALSNHLLDTPWPKVIRSRERFTRALEGLPSVLEEALFPVLFDREAAPDEKLPDTGFGLEWERILSPAFIVSPTYGTRSSTVLAMKDDGSVVFTERSFGFPEDEGSTIRYRYRIPSART